MNVLLTNLQQSERRRELTQSWRVSNTWRIRGSWEDIRGCSFGRRRLRERLRPRCCCCSLTCERRPPSKAKLRLYVQHERSRCRLWIYTLKASSSPSYPFTHCALDSPERLKVGWSTQGFWVQLIQPHSDNLDWIINHSCHHVVNHRWARLTS